MAYDDDEKSSTDYCTNCTLSYRSKRKMLGNLLSWRSPFADNTMFCKKLKVTATPREKYIATTLVSGPQKYIWGNAACADARHKYGEVSDLSLKNHNDYLSVELINLEGTRDRCGTEGKLFKPKNTKENLIRILKK